MKKTDKDRLEEVVRNKIQTTMIGAIAAIEKNFADLLNHAKYRENFDNARKEILDLGNKQIRNIATEMKNYDVQWNRYSITLTPYRKDNHESN